MNRKAAASIGPEIPAETKMRLASGSLAKVNSAQSIVSLMAKAQALAVEPQEGAAGARQQDQGD